MLCDMEAIHGDATYAGYFDGPLAYKIIQKELSKTKRSQADKDFYRTAMRLQEQHQLPDGATAAEYSKIRRRSPSWFVSSRICRSHWMMMTLLTT